MQTRPIPHPEESSSEGPGGRGAGPAPREAPRPAPGGQTQPGGPHPRPHPGKRPRLPPPRRTRGGAAGPEGALSPPLPPLGEPGPASQVPAGGREGAGSPGRSGDGAPAPRSVFPGSNAPPLPSFCHRPQTPSARLPGRATASAEGQLPRHEPPPPAEGAGARRAAARLARGLAGPAGLPPAEPSPRRDRAAPVVAAARTSRGRSAARPPGPRFRRAAPCSSAPRPHAKLRPPRARSRPRSEPLRPPRAELAQAPAPRGCGLGAGAVGCAAQVGPPGPLNLASVGGARWGWSRRRSPCGGTGLRRPSVSSQEPGPEGAGDARPLLAGAGSDGLPSVAAVWTGKSPPPPAPERGFPSRCLPRVLRSPGPGGGKEGLRGVGG